MDQLFTPVKYGVGIDMGKDEFYACVSAIDNAQRVKIKATHAFKTPRKASPSSTNGPPIMLKTTPFPSSF